jgi:hypothetical protein
MTRPDWPSAVVPFISGVAGFGSSALDPVVNPGGKRKTSEARGVLEAGESGGLDGKSKRERSTSPFGRVLF